MRQRVTKCIFHRHEVPDKSECIQECAQLTDVLHVLDPKEKKMVNGTATPNPFLCSTAVTALALRESISMTASYAVFTSLTRCHTVEGLTEENVISFWRSAVLFTARQILNGVNGLVRRGTPVVGVFLMRNGAAGFTVGLITKGTPRNLRLQSLLSEFCNTYTLTKTHAELPLCALHRTTTLRLWWEPRMERVTPRCVMPPIKVIVEEQRHHLSEDTQLCSYAVVNIFLCRPAASQLCGSTRKLLSTVEGNITKNIASRVVCKQEKKQPRAIASAVDDLNVPAGSKVQGRQQRTYVLQFDDLSVLEEGEHLIGVEMETLPSYRAFVPTLYGHLAPFLVVEREDA